MTTHELDQHATSVNFFQVQRHPPRITRTIWYHTYNLWLFTFSDLQTIVVPKTLFGIITLLSERSLMQDPRPTYTAILGRIPFIILWSWLNLLPLDMSNQRDVKSTVEDKVNKPWLLIPAGRLTAEETRTLMLASYAVAIFASLYLGGFSECLAFIVEGWIYNALNGANRSLFARHILNAAGCMTFASGPAQVACAHSGTRLRGNSSWFFVLSGVISTTIQFQDLYDQKGGTMWNADHSFHSRRQGGSSD